MKESDAPRYQRWQRPQCRMRHSVGGLNLSPRQSATMASTPTDQARVCLAAPPLASATLPVTSTRASRSGRDGNARPQGSGLRRGIQRLFSALPLLRELPGRLRSNPARDRLDHARLLQFIENLLNAIFRGDTGKRSGNLIGNLDIVAQVFEN